MEAFFPGPKATSGVQVDFAGRTIFASPLLAMAVHRFRFGAVFTVLHFKSPEGFSKNGLLSKGCG